MATSLLSDIQSSVPKEINKRAEKLFKTGGISYAIGHSGSGINIKVPGKLEDHYIVNKRGNDISCTCIYSEENPFCKHIIAALLFIDDQLKESKPAGKLSGKPAKNLKKPQLAKKTLKNKRNKSSEKYFIGVPKGATDFSWLKEHTRPFYGNVKLRSIELDGETIAFKVISDFYIQEIEDWVELSYQPGKIAINCSCDEWTDIICKHENYVLFYLIQHCKTDFLQRLDIKHQEQLKLEYLKKFMPGIPDQEVDDYVKTIFENDVYVIPHEKAEGFYNMESISKLLNGSVQLFSGKENKLKLELAEEPEAGEELIHGYAFGFSEENFFHAEISLLQGKPDKKKTKIASKLRNIFLMADFEGEIPPDAILFMKKKQELNVCSLEIEHDQDYKNITSLFQVSADIFMLLQHQVLYYKLGDIDDDDFIKKSQLTQTSVISNEAAISFRLEEEDIFYKLEAYCHLKEPDIFIPVQRLEMANAFIGIHEKRLFHLSRMKDYVILQHFLNYPVKRALKKEYEQFEKEIIDPLRENFNISIKMKDAAVKKVQLTPQKKKLYISEFDKFVVFTPEVAYKENEQVNILESRNIWEKNGKTVIEKVRDEKFENKFREEVRQLHPDFANKGAQGFFHLTVDKMIEDFWFLSAFEKLRSADVELYGLNELKNFKYSLHQPKINIHVESRQDWFDTTVEITYGDTSVSVSDLKKSLKNNNKFIPLDDGSIGMLPLEWLEKFQRLFRDAKQVKDKLQISKLNFNLINEYVDPEKNIELYEELQEKKKRLQSFNGIAKTKVPKNINAKLRDYQKEGLNWMNFLDEFGWGGILADDMGLGKTLQVITFLQLQKNKRIKTPSLIVAPTSLLFNWKDELQKFAPGLSFLLHYGTGRKPDSKLFSKNDLVITSYGTLVNDLELFGDFTFNYVVLDESQAIKNIMSQRYKAVTRLKAKNKLVLTGTPVENSVLELYAQMSFVNPGFLNSIKHFKDNYIKPIESGGNSALAMELKQKISPFILRRTKKKVLKELPEKSEEILYCIMSQEQQDVYDAYKKRYREYLLGLIDEAGLNNNVIHVLDGMTKLRQICNSPRLMESENLEATESVKIKELKRHIKEKTGNHKVLIFSQFVKMLNLIEKELEAEKIPFEMLHGGTSAKKREAKVNKFQNDDDCRVFLISLKAGGMGLNLTKAEYVYIVDPWWNPAVENQAIDRCYRMGQKKNVTAFRMICKDTIEEKIMELQKQKRELADNLLDSGGGQIKQLTREDIEKLFS